jgi:hypothetical protein
MGVSLCDSEDFVTPDLIADSIAGLLKSNNPSAVARRQLYIPPMIAIARYRSEKRGTRFIRT